LPYNRWPILYPCGGIPYYINDVLIDHHPAGIAAVKSGSGHFHIDIVVFLPIPLQAVAFRTVFRTRLVHSRNKEMRFGRKTTNNHRK